MSVKARSAAPWTPGCVCWGWDVSGEVGCVRLGCGSQHVRVLRLRPADLVSLVGITWGKVVSLYAVAAGLAVDCVRQAQPATVHALVDCLGEFVRKTLAPWLRRRGGWVRSYPLHPVLGGPA